MAHEPKVSLSVIEEERLSLESSDDPLLSEKQDLEAQRTAQILQPTHPDDEVSTRQKFFFLGLYFVFNLGVVLSNKAVLKMVGYTYSSRFISAWLTDEGIITVAIDRFTYVGDVNRMHNALPHRPLQTLQAVHQGKSNLSRILHPIHA